VGKDISFSKDVLPLMRVGGHIVFASRQFLLLYSTNSRPKDNKLGYIRRLLCTKRVIIYLIIYIFTVNLAEFAGSHSREITGRAALKATLMPFARTLECFITRPKYTCYKKHWHKQEIVLKPEPQLKPSTEVLMTPCVPPTLTGLIPD